MFLRLWQGVERALSKEFRSAAERQRPYRLRPRLEALEDRTLLSTPHFNSALNLDTYAWVRRNAGDPLLPEAPSTQFDWNQGSHPDSVVIDDFNGDGIPDIAVADLNPPFVSNPNSPGKISVFLGDSNGDGFFQHTQPVVDLTTSPQTIRLLESGGMNPRALIAAHLRGPDQPVDLIVANRGRDDGVGANVSVLLGNGDGTFQAPRSFDAGPFPTGLAVGAFRDNGPLDVVVANRTTFPGQATVLFGDGNGGFESSLRLGLFDATELPESVAVGYFGNGHLDFVTANSLSNNVTVVLGNGNGTFENAITYGTDTAPVSVAVADMDLDGKQDIITANNGGHDVTILFGKGNGTFGNPENFDAGAAPTSVAVGDFDQSGGPGLAVTNAGVNTVSVLTFNPLHLPDNSDLLFPPTPFLAGENPIAVAKAQLRPNMKGVLDLVVANLGTFMPDGTPLDRGSVNVFLNGALGFKGNFPTPGSFATGSQPVSVTKGVFTDSQLPDFVSANFASNDLSVWLNDRSSPGNFLPLTDLNDVPFSLDTLGVNPRKVVVGRFHDPNLLDIAVADQGFPGVVQGNVTIFLNTGNPAHPFLNDPKFVTFQFAAENTYVLDMATGHFKGINLDVAVLFFNANLNRTGIAVLLGDGQGGFLPPDQQPKATLLPEGTNPTSIAVADFKGDGEDDVAVTNFKDDPNDFSLGILAGNGDGTFAPLESFSYQAGSHVSAVAVGRLRGANNPIDIVVANQNFPGGVTIFLNDGNGKFTRGDTYFAGTNPVSIVVADLNGDGMLDIAVANINGDSVSVLFGNGDGTFQDTVAYVTGGFPTAIAAGNFFNHPEGWLDLITSNSASNDVSVIQNLGAPPPPGPGGAPFLGLRPSSTNAAPVQHQSASKGLAPPDLDQLFMVLGGAGQIPPALDGQFDAQTILDEWHAAVGRHRIHDNEMFSTLLWEETEVRPT